MDKRGPLVLTGRHVLKLKRSLTVPLGSTKALHYPQLLGSNPIFAMSKPSDYSPILNGVIWSQTILACTFVALRVYTRRYIIRALGWDDVVMVVNLVRIGYIA